MRIGFSAIEHIAKKIPNKKNFWSPMQKTEVMQPKTPHFANRKKKQVRETNFELELIKTSEIFRVDKTIFTNNSVI